MKIFIGNDWREEKALKVCEYSLRRHSSKELEIEHLSAAHSYYNRQFFFKGNQRYDAIDKKPFSTDFSFARFLVPIIQSYEGWAMFCDCDFLFKDDVQKLFALRDDSKAVMVVKHEYDPVGDRKMDGQIQSNYKKKNWSSLILWNCGHPWHKEGPGKSPALDAELVNNWSGSGLHQFWWLPIDAIGSLPPEWNHLVGWSDNKYPKAIHFTEGGPWMDKYRNVEYANDWLAEYKLMREEKKQ